MLLQVILEGLGLGALLVLVCAAGIRKGAVRMAYFYPMGTTVCEYPVGAIC